jgi:hypothetical protein
VGKIKLNKIVKGEKGQALMIVALLLIVSALIIGPMLAHVSTGLKTGKEVFEEKMQLFYAADSGIEDGLWQVENEQLSDALFGADDPPYDPYAYYDHSSSYEWDYDLAEDVNDKDVEITIRNIWIPKGITAPDTISARDIIEGEGGEAPKLVISGGIAASSTYQINIVYNYDDAEDPGGADLNVNTVGIWLPPGFDYVEDSCSLDIEPADPEGYCSGLAVVWTFGSTPLTDFPGSGGYPLERSFTFQFSGPENVNPGAALSWINTSGVDSVTYAWDADVKVYKVTSTATEDSYDPDKTTVVEAYTAKSEIREMGASISGDYCAVGNTLMEATDDEKYRSRLFRQSSADVTGISLADIESLGGVPPGAVPEDARVDAAYLYWSGWIEGSEDVIVVWSDPCDSFDDSWDPGSNWEAVGGELHGWGGGSDPSRRIKMCLWNNPPEYNLDLSPYSGQEVTVSWEQRVQGWLNWNDRFYYALSGDGGSSWSDDILVFSGGWPSSTFSDTIPEEYLTDQFRIRFFVDFNSSNEHCYIDNVAISAPAGSSIEGAKVNRVVFNGQQITANLEDCQTAPTPDSGAPDSWCYSCFYDATDLVNQFIADPTSGIESNGAGTYTLGHWTEGNEYDLYPSGSTDYPLATPAQKMGPWGGYGSRYQWTYAGWSLIIIYNSSQTEGHQLYLFPDLRYVAVATTLEFPISGFLVPDPVADEEIAAHMTCFVGDGDEHYSGDYIALKDQDNTEHPLSDGVTVRAIQTFWSHQWFSNPYENVWNGKFEGPTGSEVDGIDIDTFQVRWDENILEPDQFSATVVLGNASSSPYDAELIVVVYIIISFRSDVTSGGTISYLVRG